MSKKILFMSSAKLTAISIGLLLAVFCTIGMSFTPGEEGDNVGNPNDSTYVTGPRRSHWTETGCSTTYKNAIDYGKVVVTVVGGTGGKVSVTGTGNAQSITGNNSTAVTITWNCGYSTDGQKNDLTTKHTNNITFTANRLTGYNFLGWYEDAGCTVLKSPELSYTETFTIAHDSYSSQNTECESTPQTWNRYAKFVEIEPADLTFIAPVGGSYTVTIGGVETAVTSDIVKTGITTEVSLSATPASGYIFAGWYMLEDGGNVSDLSANANYTKTFASDATIGARFVSTSTPKFKNITKNIEYYGLRMAIEAASSGDKIVPVADCTVDGSDLVSGESYTIPSGVTLLIPYDANNTIKTTDPSHAYAAPGTPTKYRKLSFVSGVNLVVQSGGAISVSSRSQGNQPYGGCVYGAYGQIDLAEGASITLQNGSNLYCWGYITGEGEITAESGATIYEDFQIACWRGGSAGTSSAFDNNKVFPLAQYYIQNIEAKLHLEAGASEYIWTSVSAASAAQRPSGPARLIGASSGLFQISSGTLTRWFDNVNDRQMYELEGNMTLGSITISMSAFGFSLDINSADYVLPLTNNMDITIKSGTMTCNQKVAVLPGAKITINEGASVSLGSSSEIYVYDKDEWPEKDNGYNYPGNVAFYPINYTATPIVHNRTYEKMNDGILDVNGTLTTSSGHIYTTSGKADICSSNGTGKIVFSAAAGTKTNTYQCTQSGTSVSAVSIPITAAQLHNDDGYYTTTSGAPANTTINYKHGHWGWRVVWKLEDGTELKRAYYYKQPDATWISNNKPAETHPDAGTSSCTYTFNGWSQETISAQQEIEVTASFTKTCPNYYEVIWKSEDGSLTLETDASVGEGEATHYNGEALTKATNWTTYTEYEFDGWATEANGAKVYDDGATPAATADVTYYAHFKSIGMAASVTVSGQEPEIYKTLPEAFDAANTKANCTIKILNEVSGITSRLVYDRPNGVCTLDLNNHTVSGAVPYTDKNNIGGLIVINASGSTFAITDNSDEKNGRIENIKAQNQVTYGVLLSVGTLNVSAGTIHVENNGVYNNSNYASLGARAIQQAANTTLNISGGRIESFAGRNAYGILQDANATTTTMLTMTGGDIYVEAPAYAYGVSAKNVFNFSNGTITVRLNTSTVNSNTSDTNADRINHRYGYGIMMTGAANATASSNIFSTLNMTGGKVYSYNDNIKTTTQLHTYGIYFNGGSTNVAVGGSAAVDGTYSQKWSAKGTISNAEIYVENTGRTAYGVFVVGNYNSKDNKSHVVKISNTKITTYASYDAIGVYANASIGTTSNSSTRNLAAMYHADIELNNCEVKAETTSSVNAYAVYGISTSNTIYSDQTEYDASSKTDIAQTRYTGEYATASKITINGGTYSAKSAAYNAFAVNTSVRSITTYGTASKEYANRIPGGHKKDSVTLTIKGGTFNATSGSYQAYGIYSGGKTTIDDATFNVVAGSYYAYGLYVLSGKLTATNVQVNDTAKGCASSSDTNAYAYAVYATCGIPSGNTAQTGFAYAGEVELNNCTINAIATNYQNARGIMVNATNKLHNWAQFKADSTSNTSTWAKNKSDYATLYRRVFPCTIEGRDSVWVGIAAKATVNGGKITVKTKTTTAYGAFVNRALKYSYTKPNVVLEEYQAQLDLNGTEFDVQTEGTTTAEGVRSYGQTTITDGSFFVKPASTTAYGLKVYSGKTIVNGNPTFTIKATKTAYGIHVGGEAPHSKLGYGYDGEIEVNGGTFNVETTSDKPAYGLYVFAGSTPITSTASGYYAGNYATAGKATINAGEFNVTSKKTEAYGIYISPTVSQSGATDYPTATATPVCNVNDGAFTATGTTEIAYGAFVSNGATLTVTDGTFKGKLTDIAADKYAVGAYIAAGGILDATGGTFEAEAAKSGLAAAQKSYACGLYSPDGTATISASNATFKGELKSTYLSNGGATTWSGGAYGFYARTTTPLSLTNCTIIGNSAYQGGFGLRFANTPAEVRNCNITVTTTKAYNYGLFVGGADCDVKLYDCSFNCTSGTTYAYGIYAYNGATYAEDCEINAMVQRTGASSVGNSNLYGVLVATGKTATLKDCSITATGSGKYSNNGYGVYVDGTANLNNCDVAVSNINDGAYALFNTSNTTLLNVASGKYKASATTNAASTNGTAASAKQTLNGGYYSHNTNLSKYAVSPKKVLTLRESHTLYPDYKYTINEGGTVTWKNGTTTLLSEDYLKGETPAYTSTPTKDADAQYTYTFDGWSTTDGGDKLASLPAVSADATYFAHYSKTEKKYTVNVVAGANGSVSPASVSGIGCVTASGDITATPNTGYRLDNWTLPTGVTAADGYTSESNPIHIHATASGMTITANFAAKTYTVTLDNQSATTPGAASVTATYNEAMPSIAANLPAKTGYAFGGYFSETNGGGTQYYNADGTSAHIWDVDAASPTLYAKWTSSVVETGPVLNIVDATNDGDHGTLTLNATSWPNSAAGYYINGVLCTRSGNRTIVIDYTGKEQGESFVIDVKKSGAAESYSCHSYTIPRVITSTTAITEDQNWPIFVKGATLTVDNDIATGKIYVGADAKLVINATLTAEGIYLRTTPTAAAEMLNNGSIDAQLYYTRIIDSKANYYPFGLPLDCDIEDVTMSDGSARPKYGSGWLLRWYDESSRAANGGATNNMTSKEGDPADFPTKIVGGRGYEMFSASNYYREFYFPIDHSQLESTVPVSYTENGAAGEKHAGWNVLVSPWTWTHNQISKPENITICWLEGNTWGEQDNPDVIPPSKPFAYQASPGQSIVSFTGTNIAAARRRVAAAEEPTRIQWIRLDVKEANGVGDQTSIYSHPTRYEQTYKTGIDVAKQALTSTHAILYSSHAYGDMAFAGVADAQLEQGVPLTVYSPSAQELTISMRDNDWLNRMESVWLIDKEEGMRIDLLNGYYTFNASEGTTRGRFFIQGQFKASQIATDIQNGHSGEVQPNKARKLMINQKIFIEINGRLYDATGKEVKR